MLRLLPYHLVRAWEGVRGGEQASGAACKEKWVGAVNALPTNSARDHEQRCSNSRHCGLTDALPVTCQSSLVPGALVPRGLSLLLDAGAIRVAHAVLTCAGSVPDASASAARASVCCNAAHIILALVSSWDPRMESQVTDPVALTLLQLMERWVPCRPCCPCLWRCAHWRMPCSVGH
jgi:hypothetical protein